DEQPTSRTYGVLRHLVEKQRAEREERRATLRQLLAILRRARDDEDDWYVWVRDEWAPSRPAEAWKPYRVPEAAPALSCLECDALAGYLEGFCGACWLRRWRDAGGVDGGEH